MKPSVRARRAADGFFARTQTSPEKLYELAPREAATALGEIFGAVRLGELVAQLGDDKAKGAYGLLLSRVVAIRSAKP